MVEEYTVELEFELAVSRVDVNSPNQMLELKCSHRWDLYTDFAETVDNANVVSKLVTLPV